MHNDKNLRKKYSDKEIISAFISGDNQEALRFLYKRCFPKVKRHIYINNGSNEDALDIFQDAILIVCKQIRAGKFDKQYDIDGFVYTICKNLWINKIKKENKQVLLKNNIGYENDNTDFTDFIITPEREKMVKSVLDKLGKKCVELLKYSIYHNLSSKEIAEKMNLASENAVKTQKYKCKQKLIGMIEDYPVIKELIS